MKFTLKIRRGIERPSQFSLLRIVSLPELIKSKEFPNFLDDLFDFYDFTRYRRARNEASMLTYFCHTVARHSNP